MHIIKATNINEARRQIDKLAYAKQEPIIVLGQDDDFNRKILENKKVNILILNEAILRKDYMKQRNSGLNEVLTKIAAKNNTKIAIDIDSVTKKDDIERARALARLRQNIMLAKKAGCKLIFYSDYDKKELMSIMLVLGASTSQAKFAAENNLFPKD